MLESVAAGLLNKYLGTYVDNLNTSQLNFGVWSGDIKLRNLRLKKDALDKLNLPIDVIEGYLGELTIKIAWHALSSQPVRVRIDDVYLLAAPRDSANSTPEEDAARAQAAKLEKLENAELLGQQSGPTMSAEEEQKNQSFIESLTSKVTSNLQLEIKNLHIRYEDKISVPGHPFSVGVTLSNFSMISTDSEWQPAFITDSTGAIHKLASLDSLAVYFDTDSTSLAGYPIDEAITKFTDLISRKNHTPKHQFILKPVSGTGRFIVNKRANSQVAKLDTELLFNELGFVLDADQYRDALSMVDLFHFYTRQREYRIYQPPQEEIDRNRNRALWKFAITAIKQEVHDKHKVWSWAYFEERRDDRKAYVELFKAKMRGPLSPEDTKSLSALERKLGYKDLRFYRSIARSEARKERAEHPVEAKAKTTTAKVSSWAGSWVGWATGSHPTEQHETEENSTALNDEQRKELYKAIDWDEKDAVTSAIDYPKDTLMYRARIKLETGSFTLRTDPHGSSRDLIALNFDDFRFDLGKRVEAIEATLGLGGLRVFDGTCEGSLHSQIVRVKELTAAEIEKEKKKGNKLLPPPEEREADEDMGQYDVDNEDDEDKEDKEDKGEGQDLIAGWSADSQPFFSLKFEHQPLDKRADNALAVRLRHTEIVYHRGYVEAIVAFFKPPESQLESVGALMDVASETLEGIRKETRAGLEFALAQHKTVDVHLDLNAPIIIIPEDVTVKDCQHVVLDAGHISVESDLADQNSVDTVKAKERQEYGEEDYQRLESLMYDKFYVKLEDAQLLMGPSLQVCLDALEGNHHGAVDGVGELHILERTSLKFLAQNCIINDAPNLTRFKVSGSLPSLQLNISDRKYKSMMRMIDIAIPHFNNDAEKTVTTRPALQPAARHTSFAQSKSKVPQHEDDDELRVDEDTASEGSDDEAEEEKEEDGKDEFFDTPDIADGKQNIHQKTFEFTFSVDRVQASIFRSNVDPAKPDRLLANTVLEGFKLEFGLRPYDMSVDVLLRSLYIEDKIGEQESDFRHLVTSEKLDGGHAQDLVRIRYQGVDKDSPEFQTIHEGFDKSVDVEMSTLNVVVTRSSILVLFDWVMTTFTDPDDASTPPSPAASIGGEDDLALEEISTDKLRVKVKLTSINLILNEDGLRLATLSLSAADVSVLLRSPTIRVSARLGNLTLEDNFSTTSPQEMLTIQGDELADFRYETYDPLDKGTYPGYESSVYLRTGSLRFTFRTEPVHRILVFFTKFGRMKAVYDAATQAAAQRANEMQTMIPKMHYDILVKTPIVVFPNEEGSSHDVVTARLGEISLSNEFEVSEEQVVTKINFGLHEVGLESTFRHNGEPHTLQMLQDARIDVNVKLHQNIDHRKELDRPGTLIHAKMSDVKMNLTQAQYGMLIRLSRAIPQAFAFAEEEVEDVANGSNPSNLVETSEETDKTLVTKTETTVDLLPELPTEGKDAEGHPVALKSTVELSFESGTIYLELFTLDAISQETLEEASLARFSLNGTAVKYKLLSDNSMEAEIAIRSLTVHDTRPSRLTQFREIIPASKRVDNQFMIQYSQTGGTDKSSMANVAIDSPKIIFSLDPVFALLDFFTSAFPPAPQNDDEVDESLKEADEQVIDPNPPVESTFALRLNITSPTIILLASPDKADSEAVVLSINQIEMSQQGTTALSVKKMGMFLRRMDKPKDTIRVLDDLDLTVSMDSRADAGRQVTSIEAAIEPVILRVSFRDILLINSIINRAIELSNRSNGSPPADAPNQKALETATSGPKTRGRSKSEVTRGTKTQVSNRITDASLRAQVIVTKETLRATVDGFQLILIGDMHDLPLLDVKAGKFVAKAKDWSTDLDASVMIKPLINYFNLKVSHWEPLVDPWEFVVNVSRSVSTGLLSIGISSKKRLELNLTASFIEIALTTSTLLDREGGQLFRKPRGSNAPFLLKNRTGYAIGFAKTPPKSRSYGKDNAQGKEESARSVVVADGKDLPWRFDDWRTMRENVNATSHNSLDLSIEDSAWEKLKEIHVDREGEHVHILRPKVSSVYHRLLCEVKLVDNVKIVTFRSTFLVENRSLVNAEMVIIDGNGKKSSRVYTIPPGEDCAVPILSAYNDRIKIRPDGGFGYAWPTENLHWQDLVKRPSRAILCKNPQGESFRFQAYAVHDKGDPLLRTYPRISLRLHAPLEVQNLLPHDIEYRCFDREVKHNWKAFLRAGGTSPVHVAELSHLLLMCVEVQDTVLERSGFSIINSDNPEDLPVENELVLADKHDLKLNLRMHYQKHPDAGGAFRVQIYSPYILINKTGLDFGLKTKPFFGQARHVAGQEMTSSKSVRPENDLFMFSFPSDDRKNRVLLRVGESSWSKPLSFETVGHESEVVLPSANGKEEIRLGLKVTEGLGDYKLTKVITLCPRFIVKNNFGESLRIRELGSTKDVVVASGERHDVGFIRAEQAPQLVLSFSGVQNWSAPFKLQDIGQNYVRVPDGNGGERLARVDAVLEGPCIFIRIDPETGSWPFLLRNDSDYPIEFYQAEPENQMPNQRRPPAKKYKLASHQELPYAWDFPADNRSLRILVGTGDRIVNPLEIGALVPFRFSFQGHTRTLSIDVRAESTAQVIAFSNYAEEASVFKLQRRNTDATSRPGSVMSNRDVVFEEVDVDNVTTFSFSLNLEGIGMSVVNKSMQELVYASFRGLTAKYSDSTTNVAYELGIKWIQIDNQLFGGIFPILLYPSVIPKDGKELEVHPSLQASAIILKDRAHGVTYFKYASILLQEMTIEVDEDFLFAFLDFAKFSGASGTDVPNVLTEDPKGIPEPTATSKGGDLYFEVLHLQPMQLDLSFMRTDRVNADQKVNSRNPLFFLVNILAMAIGNVNDAPVRFNALVIENARLSLPVLQSRLTKHYSTAFTGQLYRVLGSADVIGNPVGLFTNVSSGVADFFIQPYDSIMLNGNEGVGIGIARGAGSLAKKTVFGLSDSLAKVSGSIGKGLSAATLDQQYQNQRRMRQYRNKPKHALYGVTAGAASLVTSVASGFEGLATKPLEGAESGGAAGFLTGVGKGLVGVVTKPVVGIFDFANNVTEGIRNTTTVFDQTGIDRVRLPRFTASDGVLRPYSERESLGQNWLKNTENGKFFNEIYVAHLDISPPSNANSRRSEETVVCLLTTTRMLLVKITKLKLQWDVPFVDLSSVSLEPSGISLSLKERDGGRSGGDGPFLAIADQTARLWFFQHIERIVQAHNARRYG